MRNPVLATVVPSVLSTLTMLSALSAQGGLLFTTRAVETSAQCAAAPALDRVDANEIQYVVPLGGVPFTSKAFAPRVAYDVMVGDGDLDATYDEPGLFRGTDALVPPVRTAGAMRPNARSMWFSVIAATPCLVGGVFDPADIGRILPGGALERFVSAATIRAAFGIPATVSLNVDAAAYHLPTGLYLSFEDTVTIMLPTGPMTITDGAIVRIPSAALALGVSPYDGALRLTGAIAGSGQLIADEAMVDSWVVASGIDNAAAVGVSAIVDTDGLELDPAGGVFSSPFVGAAVPNVWVAGQALTGGGVITSRLGGSIAVLNGVPLGNAAGATTGAQVGLVTVPSVQSLNGLALTVRDLCHFTTETPTARIVAPGPLTVEVGGVEPGVGAAFLFLAPGVVGAGGVDASLPFPSVCFPDLYVNMFLAAVPIGADGCGSWTMPINAALLAGLAGGRIRFQAWYFNGGSHHLSTPLAVQFF